MNELDFFLIHIGPIMHLNIIPPKINISLYNTFLHIDYDILITLILGL